MSPHISALLNAKRLEARLLVTAPATRATAPHLDQLNRLLLLAKVLGR